MDAIVVNFFAGPGAAKSTMCAAVFAELKWLDVNCEMAREYTKDLVWEGHGHTLKNQMFVFGNQQHRLFALRDKVDVILTDSPLLLSIIYNKEGDSDFRSIVMKEFKKYSNLNFVLSRRRKNYNPAGRLQTEDEAIHIDERIKEMLFDNNIAFVQVPGVKGSVNMVVGCVMREVERIKLKI